MSDKKKLLIVLPVLAGILLVTIFINYGKNVHDADADIENDTLLENDLLKIHKIENKTDLQSHNDSQAIKGSGNQKSNEVEDLYEVRSLIDWVDQIDDVISSQTMDADVKIEKIFAWLRESNTPNEIRIKLYRALVQLKPINYIEEIFALVKKENSQGVKLAGMEALALTGNQLIALGYAEGQLILNLLKGIDQQTQESAVSKKLNSLVAYMEDTLAGNESGFVKIEYLTGKDAYVWDLSAKLRDSGNVKHGLSRLLDDVSVLVDQNEELLNEEHSKLNLAYLDYFSNGFSGDVPNHQDMNHFFEKIKPLKTDTLTDDAVFRHRIWITAYSYSSERGSSDYNNFIINELKTTNSPSAALVLIENGLNIIDQLEPSTREKLVRLLEEGGAAIEGGLSEEVTETLNLLTR